MRVQYAHVHKDVEEGVRVYVALHVMRRPLEIVYNIAKHKFNFALENSVVATFVRCRVNG